MNTYPLPGIYPLNSSRRIKNIADRFAINSACLEIKQRQRQEPQDQDEQDDDYYHRIDSIHENYCITGTAKHWLIETEDGFSIQVISTGGDPNGGHMVVLRSPYSTLCKMSENDVLAGDLAGRDEEVRAFCLSPELHKLIYHDCGEVREEPRFYAGFFHFEELPRE